MTTPWHTRRGQWWRSDLLYQVYPRSFSDSNGDGIGDLEGVIERLDHLEWLGVDAIWLSPVTVSPQADWGYDVADYCDVDPDYGDLATLDRLVAKADARGIGVLLDLVPNHTSNLHPWFIDARSSRDAAHRDWYVWADGGANGAPPNNWVSNFGGGAWTFDDATGQWYLHNFTPEQPDLNWWHDDVRDAFDEILNFWWDRGIAGFRIDVCTMMIKDATLRDNPPATDDDSFVERMFGQRWVWNTGRPEAHDILRHWRSQADAATPPRLLLGETSVNDLPTMVSYYGKNNGSEGGDELHLGFNFVFIESPFTPDALRAVVESTEAQLPAGGWPVWTGSNHDVSRLATRWADGDPTKVRLALLVLMSLRGTPVLYQGDEIGLEDGVLQREDLLDPVGQRFFPAYPGRDPERTPMPWSEEPGRGFSKTTATPWLPMHAQVGSSVASQRDDPKSILHFVRDLAQLRRRTDDLRDGSYATLTSPEGTWRWRRGETVTVLCNFSDNAASFDDVVGMVVISTDRSLDGSAVEGTLSLSARQGVVIEHAREP